MLLSFSLPLRALALPSLSLQIFLLVSKPNFFCCECSWCLQQPETPISAAIDINNYTKQIRVHICNPYVLESYLQTTVHVCTVYMYVYTLVHVYVQNVKTYENRCTRVDVVYCIHIRHQSVPRCTRPLGQPLGPRQTRTPLYKVVGTNPRTKTNVYMCYNVYIYDTRVYPVIHGR